MPAMNCYPHTVFALRIYIYMFQLFSIFTCSKIRLQTTRSSYTRNGPSKTACPYLRGKNEVSGHRQDNLGTHAPPDQDLLVCYLHFCATK